MIKDLNISIHTFLAEGDYTDIQFFHPSLSISIHTFLAEGDTIHWTIYWLYRDFNPHLPCGRWHYGCPTCGNALLFQSTPSLRKVTGRKFCPCPLAKIFQSTPSLRKVTKTERRVWHFRKISIHTFLAEGDGVAGRGRSRDENFNPHLPCGRWPEAGCSPLLSDDISIHTFLAEGDEVSGRTVLWTDISIHTFLAEGDMFLSQLCCTFSNFNPHLPCGRWRLMANLLYLVLQFQSTPSLRKVTAQSDFACH